MTPQKAATVKRFRVPKRTAKLVFEGDYEGAEVRVKLDVPISLYIEIQDLVDMDKPLEVFGLFGNTVLLEWNLEGDDGEPIPSDSKGMTMLPPGFANLIIQEWMQAVQSLPAPLAGTSGDGSTSAGP